MTDYQHGYRRGEAWALDVATRNRLESLGHQYAPELVADILERDSSDAYRRGFYDGAIRVRAAFRATGQGQPSPRV